MNPAKTVKLSPPPDAVRRSARPAPLPWRELWKLRGLLVLGTLTGTVCFGLWLATWPMWIQDRGGPFLLICCVVGLWQSVTWGAGNFSGGTSYVIDRVRACSGQKGITWHLSSFPRLRAVPRQP